MASDDVRDERIVRRRSRRGGEAVSRLCRAWLRAGADAFSDSMRAVADLTEEWADEDCPPGGGRPRRDR